MQHCNVQQNIKLQNGTVEYSQQKLQYSTIKAAISPNAIHVPAVVIPNEGLGLNARRV